MPPALGRCWPPGAPVVAALDPGTTVGEEKRASATRGLLGRGSVRAGGEQRRGLHVESPWNQLELSSLLVQMNDITFPDSSNIYGASIYGCSILYKMFILYEICALRMRPHYDPTQAVRLYHYVHCSDEETEAQRLA